jgi:hypothetical protein
MAGSSGALTRPKNLEMGLVRGNPRPPRQPPIRLCKPEITSWISARAGAPVAV